MLKTHCLNTDMLSVLSKCGHGDKVLIADGNYPLETKTNSMAKKVYLNLTQGIPLVTDVLKVLNETIVIERVEVMSPNDTQPSIFQEFQKIVRSVDSLETLDRYSFYEACKAEDVKLAIATGEQRTFANILLTVGVV